MYSATQHLPAIVPFAHALLRQALAPGAVAVDATAGNGHDTLLLAQLAGDTGHVYAFDVQPAAIAATRQRLQEHHLLHRVTLLTQGHETMAQHVLQSVHAVVFNLGWLPGSNKQMTTQAHTTLAALQAALQLLLPHGLLVLVVYQGHSGARAERDAIEQWAQSLDHHAYRVARYSLANVPSQPPYVLAVEKLGCAA